MAFNAVLGDNFPDPRIDFRIGDFGDLRNFISVVLEEGNVEEFLKALEAVGPDVRFSTFRV